MFEEGLLDEVKKLKDIGLTQDMQSMKGIGYKEILQYFSGEITLEEAEYLIKKGSRNYAKRQLTWFRKDKRVNWINKDNFSSEEDKSIAPIILFPDLIGMDKEVMLMSFLRLGFNVWFSVYKGTPRVIDLYMVLFSGLRFSYISKNFLPTIS